MYEPDVRLGQYDSYRPPDACNMDQLYQHATGCAQYLVTAIHSVMSQGSGRLCLASFIWNLEYYCRWSVYLVLLL